jgi:hypothetical protein
VNRERIARRASDDADGTADGGPTEQSSLRSFQDLNVVDVDQVRIGADRTCQIHAVHIHADARIEIECKVNLTDSSYGSGGALVEIHVRGQGRQLV